MPDGIARQPTVTNPHQATLDSLRGKQNRSPNDHLLMAYAYQALGQYSNSLGQCNMVIKAYETLQDTSNLFAPYNLKAENLIALNLIDEGIAFCETVSPIFGRPQDSVQLQLFSFKWGVLHFYNDDFEQAYRIYNYITLPRLRNLPIFLNNYSLTLMGLKRYDEALIYLKKALAATYEGPFPEDAIIQTSNIGMVLMIQKKWDEAKIFLDSAAAMVTPETPLSNLKSVYANYFDFYRHTGDLDKAKHYLDSTEQVNDGIFDYRINEKMNELETLYQSEYTLKKQVQQKDEELIISERNTLWAIILALVIVFGLSIIILLLRIRSIRYKNQQIQVEQKLLRSQMTPHFMFNSLSVLQGMILTKEYKKSITYLARFSQLLRLTLENSRDKAVRLEAELNAIEHYIAVQNLSTSFPYTYTVDLAETIDTSRFFIPPMLIQPFIENAIEHAFRPDQEERTIRLKISFENDNLICQVADNGIGIDAALPKKNSGKKSLATRITSERLMYFAKTYRKHTQLDITDLKAAGKNGTLVTLYLPYSYQ